MDEKALKMIANKPLDKQAITLLLTGIEKDQKRRGLKAMLKLILSTGCSLDDTLKIRLQDIDYTNDTIAVYDVELGRNRILKLPARTMGAISAYQSDKQKPTQRLFDVTAPTAINALDALAKERLTRPVTWSAIRRSWCILAFEKRIPIKNMEESSGASLSQLAVWSFYRKNNEEPLKEPVDLLDFLSYKVVVGLQPG